MIRGVTHLDGLSLRFGLDQLDKNLLANTRVWKRDGNGFRLAEGGDIRLSRGRLYWNIKGSFFIEGTTNNSQVQNRLIKALAAIGVRDLSKVELKSFEWALSMYDTKKSTDFEALKTLWFVPPSVKCHSVCDNYTKISTEYVNIGKRKPKYPTQYDSKCYAKPHLLRIEHKSKVKPSQGGDFETLGSLFECLANYTQGFNTNLEKVFNRLSYKVLGINDTMLLPWSFQEKKGKAAKLKALADAAEILTKTRKKVSENVQKGVKNKEKNAGFGQLKILNINDL